MKKKTLEETQTLRAGRSLKFFAPLQTPFPGTQDGQNFISWRWSLPSPTDPVWWKSMHAISSYRGNRPTNKQRQPARPPARCKQTGPWADKETTAYTAPLGLAVNIVKTARLKDKITIAH